MLGSFHVCAAENKREAAPGNQQLLTASTTALTRDIWEIHLLPATTLTWREKFTALDNTPPTPSSHRKSGVKIFFTPSSYFLHIWARYGDESEIQPFHAMIIQFKLRPKAPSGWICRGSRSPVPGTLQGSASQNAFPRHQEHPAHWCSPRCAHEQERSGFFLELTPKLSPARAQRCQTHSKKNQTKALHAPSLCATGETQVSSWRIAEISTQATPVIEIQNTTRRNGKN